MQLFRNWFADEEDDAVLVIFLLVVSGYLLRRVWWHLVPRLFTSGTSRLTNYERELKERVSRIEASQLAQRGRLERELLSVQKQIDAMRQVQWRYTLSLSSCYFLFQVDHSDDAQHRTTVGDAAAKLLGKSSRRVVHFINHIALIGFYNAPRAVAFFASFMPAFFYRVPLSEVQVHFPCFSPLDLLFCSPAVPVVFSGWLWFLFCTIAVNFTCRAFHVTGG